MVAARDVPIPYRIVALVQERNRLFAFPPERMANEIQATGFRCNCCGACCTHAVNGHVFLLDQEIATVKTIDEKACEPAPGPEFCDQDGVLYVSGYALRVQDDACGSCWFLENGRCRIYDRRFSACRIYPHMLRRGAGGTKGVVWQKFARPGRHGQSGHSLSHEDCIMLAREVREYENAFLTQQISFLETIHEYFLLHNLRHNQEMYWKRMQQFRQGRPIEVKVFHAGDLEECQVTGSPV